MIAWLTNRKIHKTSQKTRKVIARQWKVILNKVEIDQLKSIINDVYSSEMDRKNTIESKATSLFEGIGFAASLLSIAIVFTGQQSLSLLLFLPMIHFIVAGICSWHVTKVGKYHMVTLPGIKDDLESLQQSTSNYENHWTIEKLTYVEMNTPSLLIKSNWLSAAHQHFLLGLLLIIPILLVVAYSLLFVNAMHVFTLCFTI